MVGQKSEMVDVFRLFVDGGLLGIEQVLHS